MNNCATYKNPTYSIENYYTKRRRRIVSISLYNRDTNKNRVFASFRILKKGLANFIICILLFTVVCYLDMTRTVNEMHKRTESFSLSIVYIRILYCHPSSLSISCGVDNTTTNKNSGGGIRAFKVPKQFHKNVNLHMYVLHSSSFFCLLFLS